MDMMQLMQFYAEIRTVIDAPKDEDGLITEESIERLLVLVDSNAEWPQEKVRASCLRVANVIVKHFEATQNEPD